MALIPCRFHQIVFDEQIDSQTVFLCEINGDRRLAIVIGVMEAVAIDRAIRAQPFERPLTHDLLTVILVALRTTLQEVRIVDCRDGTYFADLVLAAADGGIRIIDSRPSDALALVVRHPGCPLMIEESLLDSD